MKRILVLFPKDWDRDALCAPKFRGRYEFLFEGFDLFKFPQNAALLTFDVHQFIERIVERYPTTYTIQAQGVPMMKTLTIEGH